jgi:hypothetical protein
VSSREHFPFLICHFSSVICWIYLVLVCGSFASLRNEERSTKGSHEWARRRIRRFRRLHRMDNSPAETQGSAVRRVMFIDRDEERPGRKRRRARVSGRHISSPGVSPGISPERESSLRSRRHRRIRRARCAVRFISPLRGSPESSCDLYPGLTPGATNMPPASQAG